VPPDQLLDLAIHGCALRFLRVFEVPRAQPLKFHIIPVARESCRDRTQRQHPSEADP